MTRKEIEAVLLAAVRTVYRTYPSCEWDDLVSQAWLIVTERMGEYEKGKGTLKSFIFKTIQYRLGDYVRRVVLKGLNMNGLRVHTTQYDGSVPDCTSMVEARDVLDKLYAETTGVSGDILELMDQGFTQREVSEKLGISQQRVITLLKRIREEHND